jgi:hypothetical protein
MTLVAAAVLGVVLACNNIIIIIPTPAHHRHLPILVVIITVAEGREEWGMEFGPGLLNEMMMVNGSEEIIILRPKELIRTLGVLKGQD